MNDGARAGLVLAAALILTGIADPMGAQARPGVGLDALLGVARQGVSAEDLIRHLVRHAPRAEFVGIQETVVFVPRRQRSSQKVIQKGGRQRILFLAPPHARGRKIYRDGPVTLFGSGSTAPPDIGLEEDLGRLVKTIIGTGSVAGRSAFVIELRPPDRSSSSLRIWVDMETWVPLQWEGRDASGRLVSKTAYRSIQFDSPIPDPVLMPPSRFFDVQPTLPIPVPDDGEGARVAGFRPRRPGYLPPGYRFQTQTVASFGRGNRTAQRVTLLFSNGLGVISLVEAPAVAIQSAPPPGRLRWTPLGQLVWVRDGLHHVLHATPPLSREEMRRIADSVR